MNRKTKGCSKRKKSWRFYLGYWSPVIIGVIVLTVLCIVRIIAEREEPVQVSKSFNSTYTITPQPSVSPSHELTQDIDSTYQIPSELLEEIALLMEVADKADKLVSNEAE